LQTPQGRNDFKSLFNARQFANLAHLKTLCPVFLLDEPEPALVALLFSDLQKNAKDCGYW